jgi:two-component sensor histidine kinase
MIKLYKNVKNWFIGELLNETEDFYQKSKINLIFDFPFFTLTLFIFFSILLFIVGANYSVLTITGSWLMGIFFLFFLKYSKNIRIASILLSTVILILAISNLLLNDKILHIGYPFWLCMLLLFVVFNLGIYWGIGFGVIGAIAYIYYRQFEMYNAMELANFDPNVHLITFIVEVSLTTFLILYLVQLFLLTSRKSELAMKEQNKLLIDKNKLIEDQHAEKTIMLKEIHHRVKNNLQVVNSILRLQSHEIKDPEALEVFELSQKRIHAMALIHERLYTLDKLSYSITADYLKLLVKDLVDLYQNHQQIELIMNVQDGIVPQNNIVPFGLILNELISNTLKHGIESKGVISISSEKNEKTVSLIFQDNGKGFANEIHKGFGLELIETLTEQLDGTVNYHNNQIEGVFFQFEYPYFDEEKQEDS